MRSGGGFVIVGIAVAFGLIRVAIWWHDRRWSARLLNYGELKYMRAPGGETVRYITGTLDEEQLEQQGWEHISTGSTDLPTLRDYQERLGIDPREVIDPRD